VALITAEALGWEPVDQTGRYWRHVARYGEAIFDASDVQAIETNSRRRAPIARRAPACRCRNSYGRLEEGVCWGCG